MKKRLIDYICNIFLKNKIKLIFNKFNEKINFYFNSLASNKQLLG